MQNLVIKNILFQLIILLSLPLTLNATLSQIIEYLREWKVTMARINAREKATKNSNQMKIISERNHGKIFTEKNGQVALWKPIKDFIVSKF